MVEIEDVTIQFATVYWTIISRSHQGLIHIEVMCPYCRGWKIIGEIKADQPHTCGHCKRVFIEAQRSMKPCIMSRMEKPNSGTET